MSDSILTSTKKALGIEADYDVYDPDLIMYINSVFSTLTQLGVGPASGFMIEDDSAMWSDFIGDEQPLNSVKTYMVLRVKMLFDRPDAGPGIAAVERMISELEWRINVTREVAAHPLVVEPTTPVVIPLFIDGGTPSNGGV